MVNQNEEGPSEEENVRTHYSNTDDDEVAIHNTGSFTSNAALEIDDILSVSTPRAGSSLSDVFSDTEEIPQYRLQPVQNPILPWRHWVDPYSGRIEPKPLDRDPLGPFRIERITRPTPPGTTPDLRYYDFPNGNEGIENVYPPHLTPSWHAWAGWLGPHAAFRVRWGSPFPIRNQDVDERPPPLRRSRPVPKSQEKSFKIDCLIPFFYGGDRIFSKTCRTAFSSGCTSESCSCVKELSVEGNHTFWENIPQNPTISSPDAREPFNMFPNVLPPHLDFPYRGALSFFSRLEVRLAAMFRCLQLHLSPVGSVYMRDPIGLFLRFGPEGPNRRVEPDDPNEREIEEELD